MGEQYDYTDEGRMRAALERIADALEEGNVLQQRGNELFEKSNALNQAAWDEGHDEELVLKHMQEHADMVADAQMRAQTAMAARGLGRNLRDDA